MVQDEIKEELIKLKNELKDKDLGSFNFDITKKSKENKYINKKCGNYEILILESDNEMKPILKIKELKFFSKEIINLVKEIDEKIKSIKNST